MAPLNRGSSASLAPNLPRPALPETCTFRQAPATTFPKFSELPQELRLAIWDYNILPATVSINCDDDGPFDQPTRPKPVILDVNGESRAYGLEHYSLAFGQNSETPRIFFNYSLDIAYTKHIWSLDLSDSLMFNTHDTRKLKYWMLTRKILHMYSRGSFSRFSEFSALECVYVICDTLALGYLGDLSQHRHEQLKQMTTSMEQIPPAIGKVSKGPQIRCCQERLEWADSPLPSCTIHWWFDVFNEKAKSEQQQNWQEVFLGWMNISDEHIVEHCGFDPNWVELHDDDDISGDYADEREFFV